MLVSDGMRTLLPGTDLRQTPPQEPVEQDELRGRDQDRERGDGDGVEHDAPEAHGVAERGRVQSAVDEQDARLHRREVLPVKVAVVLARGRPGLDALDLSLGNLLDAARARL